MGLISKLGYSRFSPYRNSPFLDINTPNGLIDMSNTDVPLLGIGYPSGVRKLLGPRSGIHSFPGDIKVREVKLPIAQIGLTFEEQSTSSINSEKAKEWYKKWYTERGENPKFTQVANKRLNILPKLNFEEDPYLLKTAEAYGTYSYYPNNYTVSIDTSDNPIGRSTPTLLHEYGHVFDQNAPQKNRQKIFKQNNLKDPYGFNLFRGKHNELGQSELLSRLDVFRMIYNIDPKKNYTVDEMKKIIDEFNVENPSIKTMEYKDDGKFNVRELFDMIKNDPEKLRNLNRDFVTTNVENLPKAQKGDLPDYLKGSMRGDIQTRGNQNLLTEISYQKSKEKKAEEKVQKLIQYKNYDEKAARRAVQNKTKSGEKDLKEIERVETRAAAHPDYKPGISFSQMQALSEAGDLRSRLLRGSNLLTNTGDPFLNFVTGVLTAPGRSFANITTDAKNRYLNPILQGNVLEGVTNFGLDLFDVAPATVIKGASTLGTGAKNVAQQTGEYLTTQTPLRNAYKYNPWAFKPQEGMMYRGIGKEGMEDALESKVFRANPYRSLYNSNSGSGQTRFTDNAYYSPQLNIAQIYNKNYIAEVPRSSGIWNVVDPKVPIQFSTRNIPISEGRILKKDWLKGYKEVPKPTTASVNVNPVANITQKDLQDGLINILKQQRPSWFIKEPPKTVSTDIIDQVNTSNFLEEFLKNPNMQSLYTPVNNRIVAIGKTDMGLNPHLEGGRKIRLVDEGVGLFKQKADKFEDGYNLYDLLNTTQYHIRKNKYGGALQQKKKGGQLPKAQVGKNVTSSKYVKKPIIQIPIGPVQTNNESGFQTWKGYTYIPDQGWTKDLDEVTITSTRPKQKDLSGEFVYDSPTMDVEFDDQGNTIYTTRPGQLRFERNQDKFENQMVWKYNTPSAIADRKRMDEIRRTGPQLNQAQEERPWYSKLAAVATHPLTAWGYNLRGERMPDYFERGSVNPVDRALQATAILAGARSLGFTPSAISKGLSTPILRIPGLTTGNLIGLGFGMKGAIDLGRDVETGYYSSDAPLIDKIARGVETGLNIGFNPGMIPAIGSATKSVINLPKHPLIYSIPQVIKNKAYKDYGEALVFSGLNAATNPNLMKLPGYRDFVKRAAFKIGSYSGGQRRDIRSVFKALTGKPGNYIGMEAEYIPTGVEEGRNALRNFIYGDATGYIPSTIPIRKLDFRHTLKYPNLKTYLLNTSRIDDEPLIFSSKLFSDINDQKKFAAKLGLKRYPIEKEEFENAYNSLLNYVKNKGTLSIGSETNVIGADDIGGNMRYFDYVPATNDTKEGIKLTTQDLWKFEGKTYSPKWQFDTPVTNNKFFNQQGDYFSILNNKLKNKEMDISQYLKYYTLHQQAEALGKTGKPFILNDERLIFPISYENRNDVLFNKVYTPNESSEFFNLSTLPSTEDLIKSFGTWKKQEPTINFLNMTSKPKISQLGIRPGFLLKKGGQYGGLDRWFAEKWVDIKTGKTCGRQEGEKRAYPACRPSKRVSSETPKTSSELSSEERAKFKRTKTSSKRISYNHKRN